MMHFGNSDKPNTLPV